MHIYLDESHEEEHEAPRVIGAIIEEGTLEEHDDHDMTEPHISVYPLQ